MPRHGSSFGLALAALLALAGGTAAQDATHTLHGRVVEEGSGQPVRGALVRVETPRPASALTGEDGRWRIAGIPAGSHSVRVERLGYGTRTVAARLPQDAAAELRVEVAAQALPLDAVVVTASRRLQRLADTPVSTELITRREMARSGGSDLATALAERTGIRLSGGRPFGEGVMLQGFSSERVLVLLDGQPLGGWVAGTLDVSRIPLSIVERVEVVKGSQSALYGSQAMGGVINIITRRPEDERWTGGAELTAGTGGRAGAALLLQGRAGPAAFLAEGGRRAIDAAPGRVDQSGALSERWDGFGKATWMPGERVAVEASALAIDEFQRWQSGQLYYFVDNAQRSARATATRTGAADRLSGTLHLSDFDHLFRRATLSMPVDGAGEREAQRLWGAEVLYNLAGERYALDLGLEGTREVRTSDRFAGGARTLHTLDPFVQGSWAHGGLSVVPGLRLSWSEQWGAALTPRLATLYRPIPSLALRASVGRGYRAPNFEELYLEFLNTGPGFAYLVRGNEELRPETSTGLSAGAEWTAGPLYLRGQLFRNRFRDFIENRLAGDADGATLYSYGNVAAGLTQGLELEGGLVRGGTRLEGGYGYLAARDLGSEQPLLGQPAHSGRLTLQQALPLGARSALSASYTGATPVRHTEARTVSRDGFTRLDLRLARTLPHQVEATLGVRNLLDAQPEEWPGQVGRHLYVGLSWRAAK